MRLFTAIPLDDPTKTQLCNITATLRRQRVTGTYTRRENLHLTLVFIGETDRVQELCGLLDALTATPFSIRLAGRGVFRQRGGDLHWLGVESSPVLQDLQYRLSGMLGAAGFAVDPRPYRPHITLCRRAHPSAEADLDGVVHAFAPLTVPVNSVSLMRSRQIGGRPVYTEIHRAPLLQASDGAEIAP